jgi:hypothetical protein
VIAQKYMAPPDVEGVRFTVSTGLPRNTWRLSTERPASVGQPISLSETRKSCPTPARSQLPQVNRRPEHAEHQRRIAVGLRGEERGVGRFSLPKICHRCRTSGCAASCVTCPNYALLQCSFHFSCCG